MRSFKLAFRTLLQTPFVTLVAIISLALGIGANGAIFSLFEQLLLRNLPVREPGQLVNLGAPGPKPGSQSCNGAGDCEQVFSYPMFRDLEQKQTVFAGLAAHRAFGLNFAFKGQSASGEGMLVSGSYFPTLGLTPALGRLLGPGDDAVIGGAPVVVLSHRTWRNRFGEDPGVLETPLIVNGHPLTIVGVAPAGFRGTSLGIEPEVFVPITLRGLMLPGFTGFDNRRSYWVYLFARLAPGVTLEQAKAALNVPYHAIVNEVELPLQSGLSPQAVERFKVKELTLEAGRRGQSGAHAQAQAPFILLFTVAGVVLLIACANIANLLLARAAARGSELAVRLSIGASRRQLIGQLLRESCLLAAFGGLVSLLVAHWTLRAMGLLLPADAVGILELSLNLKVVAFAAALALGTGLLFGIVPALHSTDLELAAALKGQAGQPAGGRNASRFRTALVVAQIALSTALLVPAGLFVKSLLNVSRVDLGLDVSHLITFSISPELNNYSAEQSRALFLRAEEELAALPGVQGVTASLVPLLAGSNWGTDVRVQGFPEDPDVDRNVRYNEVGVGYFRTLGVPLLTGREFTAADALGRPSVAVVNETFAKKFNLGREAVGKRMSRGDDSLEVEIVGLVQDAKYSDVKDAVPPLFFTPYPQDDQIGSINFYVKTALAPEQVMSAIPSVIARLDPNLPIEQLKTLPQQVQENIFVDRFLTTLATSFAALATLLAAVGLYGVLAYTVAQRTREFGLRMALGADRERVRGMVLWQVGKLAAMGGGIGLAAALGLGKLARSLLFELEGHDPLVLTSTLLLLALVALGSGLIPALRAARIDPLVALRYE